MARSVREVDAQLANALDRLTEAHWWIHEMDRHYHYALPFRYYLNSFLRALKEVPQILMMEMQNTLGFKKWYKEATREVYEDELLTYLFKQRDLVVHRSMLLPQSKALYGITEGCGLKAGIGGEVDPQLDSVDVMFRYIVVAAERGDWFGLLRDDEESLPCVERQWRLDRFPDIEVADLVADAWRKVGTLVAATVEWLGGPDLNLELSCRHADSTTRFLTFDRERRSSSEFSVESIFWRPGVTLRA